MAKVLVLYYSMYGHIETMAHAVAEGANRVDGVEVVVKRVPETMQAEAFAKAGGKTQNAPVATPQELADYDAIIFGTPTRFGNMSGQMRTFLDQTGGLWASGALYGKLASVFSSTGTAAARSRRSLPPGQRLRIMGWSLCRLATARRNCLMSPRSVVVRPMAQQRLPVGMVHVSQAMKNFQSPAIRVNTSRVLPKN